MWRKTYSLLKINKTMCSPPFTQMRLPIGVRLSKNTFAHIVLIAKVKGIIYLCMAFETGLHLEL